MDRGEFIKKMNEIEKGLSPSERDEIMQKSIYRDGVDKKCVIIMEEMAELQQQVSKQIRYLFCADRVSLLEEIADVYISLMFLKDIFRFSDDQIEKAIDVKMLREKERLDREESSDSQE